MTVVKHATPEANNAFAHTLKMMGEVYIVKEFYNPLMCSWHKYTGGKR